MTDHKEIIDLLEKAGELLDQQTGGQCPWCGANDYPVCGNKKGYEEVKAEDAEEWNIKHEENCIVTLIDQALRKLRTAQEPCETCGGSRKWPQVSPLNNGYPEPCPDCTAPEPNCEGCEFFKHNNKYEHCWRYTQPTSVCKLRHKEQPPTNDLTDWLRKTISGDRHEKGDPELQAKVREACDRLDRAEAEIKQARDVAFRWQQIAQERKERADKMDTLYTKCNTERLQLEAKLKAKAAIAKQS